MYKSGKTNKLLKVPKRKRFLFNLISMNGIANKQIEDSPFYLLLIVEENISNWNRLSNENTFFACLLRCG